MSPRVRRTLATGVALAGALLRTAPAGARVPERPRIASLAHLLAARIRHDARRGGPRSTTKVIRGRHDGRRTLVVFYRARPGEYSQDGAYRLALETEGGEVREAAIEEFRTSARYHFGATPIEVTFALRAFHDRSPLSRGHWVADIEHNFAGCNSEPPPLTVCEGIGRDHLLSERDPPAMLRAAFRSVDALMARARSHAPITPQI
jgi:hypothetical protein